MTTKQTLVLFTAMLPLCLSAAESTNRLRFPVGGFSIAALEASPGSTAHMPLAMSLPSSGNFSANANVQIQPYEGTIEEYAALTLKQFKDHDLKVMEQKKVGKFGIIFQYSGELQGRPLRWYARAEKSGNHVYLVTATAAEEQWAEQASQLKACVDSFQAEKAGSVAPKVK
jgi:hypothetical protein